MNPSLSKASQEVTVTGPDGIPIREKPFTSREAAKRGVAQLFAQLFARFEAQGYYAGVDGRLAVEEIAGRCTIEASR
jgi:hypothetical protein